MTSEQFTIIIDTREQLPYDFPGESTSHETMQTGDYTVKGFEDTFAVERKSLDDLVGTISSGRARFLKEIERAQAFERFVVVIEADYSDVDDYRDKKNCPNYYSRMHPNSVLGTVEKWPLKFDKLDFVWAGDRTGAKALTLDLLRKWAVEYGDDRMDELL